MGEEDDRRRRYFDDYKDRIQPHRERAAYYETHALEFASSAFKVLTYLNGGGLVAIPTVVALFKADPTQVKNRLIYAGLAFVSGLVLIVLAQTFVFFVMARRAEAEQRLQAEQEALLALVHYPKALESVAQVTAAAAQQRAAYGLKHTRSDRWRLAAMIVFWLSVGCFIAGCVVGAMSVLG
jgi:hypothetical protein